MNRSIDSRRLVLSATAIGSAVVLAACGAAADSGTTAAADQALEYVRCLRSHGVPNFPDPGPGGRLPNIPAGIDTATPAFRSAQNSCARLMPGGSGSGAASQSGSSMLRLLAVARCMRRHGLPNFPDPTTSPPPAPPPGIRAGTVLGVPGAYLVFPPRSPALSRASAACGFGPP